MSRDARWPVTVAAVTLPAAVILAIFGLIPLQDIPEQVSAPVPPPTVERIDGPAQLPDASPVAVRLPTTTATTTTTAPESTTTVETIPAPPVCIPACGIWGLPLAPEGLDDCATSRWYREQFGLPEVFDRLSFRESRCIAREDVRTSCCVSRLQLYVRLHIQNDVLRLRYEACGVRTEWDIDGPEPIEQQRAMCAAAALYDLNGLSPWAMP